MVRRVILAKHDLRKTRRPPNGPIVLGHNEGVPMVIFPGEAIGFGEEEGAVPGGP